MALQNLGRLGIKAYRAYSKHKKNTAQSSSVRVTKSPGGKPKAPYSGTITGPTMGWDNGVAGWRPPKN